MISKLSAFQNCPNEGPMGVGERGECHQISVLHQIKLKSTLSLEGGGQENYGLFPLFGTCFWAAFLIKISEQQNSCFL